MEKYFFRATVEDFKKIPGNPVAYWISDAEIKSFSKHKSMSCYSISSNGVQTGNNAKYLRLWYEVLLTNKKKWFPYNKGGPYRKWYGNYEYLVNWENNGYEIKNEKNHCVRGEEFYFKSGITWSDVTSGRLSSRLLPEGFLFDASGPSAFFEDESAKLAALMALNTFHVGEWSKMLNPTLHFQSGDFRKIPLSENFINSETSKLAKELIFLSKSDWNSYETSWDFTTLPLLQPNYRQVTLEATYQSLRTHWQENTLEMQRLEEENNRIFIEAYGLEDELTPDVPLEEITLTCNPHYRYRLGKAWDDKSEEERTAELETRLQQDTMKEFISYAVGCMFGRYSLDKEGLILANQGETLEDYLAQVPNPSFMPDDDNVIPMLDGDWFTDDIVERFKDFLKVTFGEEHYDTNLTFIENALNVRGTRNYSIRDYFLRDFYDDHVRTYKRRPIYWLFSSPNGSFNALIYMHRYRPDTASVVLNGYLREYQSKLKSHKQNLEAISIGGGSQTEKTRALKEIERINKVLHELEEYEREVLYPLATEQVDIDLDDGVKQNYPKLGKALKQVRGL